MLKRLGSGSARSARKHGGEQVRELFAFAHSSLCFSSFSCFAQIINETC